MIEVVNGTITIPNWEKHQTVDAVERYKEQARERALNYRQRQKAIAAENSSVTQSNVTRNVTHNVTRNVTVTQNHAIEEDIEEDIDKNIKEIDKEKLLCSSLTLELFGFREFAWEDKAVKTGLVDKDHFAVLTRQNDSFCQLIIVISCAPEGVSKMANPYGTVSVLEISAISKLFLSLHILC